MGSKYTNVSEVPTDVICNRLEELSHAVTVSDRKMMREFTMRVPVEVDRDADVVISEAARRLAAAGAQLERVQWKVEAFDAMCEVGLIQFDPNIENHCYSVWGFTCWHHDQDILKAIAAANEPVKMKAIEELEKQLENLQTEVHDLECVKDDLLVIAKEQEDAHINANLKVAELESQMGEIVTAARNAPYRGLAFTILNITEKRS